MSQSLRVSRIHFVAWIDTGLWRALAFTRSLQRNSPWLARQLRRTVLLLWWTATFQLHIHGRLWLRARRLRGATPAVAPVAVIDAVNPRSLNVPFSADPVVSVIVPTYGQVRLTLMCLASIADHAPALPIEVIVVDDAWNGVDAHCLEQVPGIRLIRNETNLGYLHSCNKAATVAKGRYLLFLNNDTEMSESWLEPMVSLFRQRPGTGAVGAKLLNPDRSLQEAGGIIWQDASGWNFGRLEDPSKPAYNYVREVDYCSAAALMVERQVFANLVPCCLILTGFRHSPQHHPRRREWDVRGCGQKICGASERTKNDSTLAALIQQGQAPRRPRPEGADLLKADVSEAGEGWSDSRIVKALDVSPATIYRTRQRSGARRSFEAVLARPACPELGPTTHLRRRGRGETDRPDVLRRRRKARATVDLAVAWQDTVVELNIVERASDNTIGRTLKKTTQPHEEVRKFNPPNVSAAFVANMLECRLTSIARHANPYALSSCLTRPRST